MARTKARDEHGHQAVVAIVAGCRWLSLAIAG
jgi:hypothetical protein